MQIAKRKLSHILPYMGSVKKTCSKKNKKKHPLQLSKRAISSFTNKHQNDFNLKTQALHAYYAEYAG